VRLTCVLLAGNPAPRISWTRHGEAVASSGRVIDVGDGNLYLKNVSVEDEGEYSCTASNIGGTASDSVELDVLGSHITSAFCFIVIIFFLILFTGYAW